MLGMPAVKPTQNYHGCYSLVLPNNLDRLSKLYYECLKGAIILRDSLTLG